MRKWVLLAFFLFFLPTAAAQSPPQVMGYGVKGCRDYADAYAGREAGDEVGIAEYRRYQDWLTGIVTGLSLATATDVLKGVEVNSALRRIEIYCDEHPDEDFFNAAMDLIRTLSVLE